MQNSSPYWKGPQKNLRGFAQKAWSLPTNTCEWWVDLSFTPGFSPVLADDTAGNRFNSINILDAPVFAPEEQDAYSLRRDTARALQRIAMD